LLASPAFKGRVFALDFARQMLTVAVDELSDHHGSVAWIWQNAMNLPFPDNRFDLVTCIEALEFMPGPGQVLTEMVRVLQPGGWLLITRRRGWQSRLFLGKTWTKEALLARLHGLGLVELRIQPWQVDYDLVWASKPGRPASPVLPASDWQTALVRCPRCASPLEKGDQLLSCNQCQVCYDVRDRLIELAAGGRCPRSMRE
jgi:SAM-dependent methyltransferase